MIRKITIQPKILFSNCNLFNTRLRASRSDLEWLSIYFHERLLISCASFFKIPVGLFSRFPLACLSSFH